MWTTEDPQERNHDERIIRHSPFGSGAHTRQRQRIQGFTHHDRRLYCEASEDVRAIADELWEDWNLRQSLERDNVEDED